MALTEKYVTVAGAGLHDGSSELNAWTFAEMIAANPAAGSRINIKSGSYSEGITTIPSGTAAAPLILRGYNSTIGDLDIQGRNADGTLNTTNMPDFTLTGLWTPGAFCIFQNLDVTGALSSALIGSAVNDNFSFISCRVVNTQNNLSARSVQGDNGINAYNCDFECTGAAHITVVDCDTTHDFYACRFKGVDTDALLSCEDGAIDSCAFIGIGKTGGNTGIQFLATSAKIKVKNCTFYNLTTAISFPNLVNSHHHQLVNNICTDCGEFVNSLYSATAAHGAILINNRTRDNTSANTGLEIVEIGSITTDTGGAETDYVNAAAGNLRLISTSPAKATAMPAYMDCGAYQIQESSIGGSYIYFA